jgi:uncharacterized protein YndB with AHSA1/START domain
MYCVVAQRELPLPPLELWPWLTRPDLLARWFADSTPPASLGDVRFDFGDGDFFAGRITESDPGILLGFRWRFVDLGPWYDVYFSLLKRKTGTELSIVDRGALTTEEAECLRVGWSEFLLRLEKAITRQCSTRFSWRKALSFTGCADGLDTAPAALLRDPGRLGRALEDVQAEITEEDDDRVMARLTARGGQWGAAATDLLIRRREIRGRQYLFLSHEGWPRLPGELAARERRRYVGLWREALTSLGVQ